MIECAHGVTNGQGCALALQLQLIVPADLDVVDEYWRCTVRVLLFIHWLVLCDYFLCEQTKLALAFGAPCCGAVDGSLKDTLFSCTTRSSAQQTRP